MPPPAGSCISCRTLPEADPSRGFVRGALFSICGACIPAVHRRFQAARRGEVVYLKRAPPDASHARLCSFCALDPDFTGGLAVWEFGSICRACVDLIVEILAEEAG